MSIYTLIDGTSIPRPPALATRLRCLALKRKTITTSTLP